MYWFDRRHRMTQVRGVRDRAIWCWTGNAVSIPGFISRYGLAGGGRRRAYNTVSFQSAYRRSIGATKTVVSLPTCVLMKLATTRASDASRGVLKRIGPFAATTSRV